MPVAKNLTVVFDKRTTKIEKVNCIFESRKINRLKFE